MIDLHSHLLPGLDDGPGTLEESLALARTMAADGIRCVAATPHVNERWPTEAEAMERALGEMRSAVAAAGIALEVRGGAEIELGRLPGLSAGERARLGLGGNPRLLLLEFPYIGWPLDLADTVFQLKLDGVTAVIAHPERSAEVAEAPERLEPIVHAGGLVQLTAPTVEGRDGPRLRGVAHALLERGWAHLIASDAHNADARSGSLSAACSALGDAALARWLTEDVPAALLDGHPLPERPSRPARRGWRDRFGRS